LYSIIGPMRQAAAGNYVVKFRVGDTTESIRIQKIR